MDTEQNINWADVFFAIVNTEVFVWDVIDEALRNDANIALVRYVPLRHLAMGPLRVQELASACGCKRSAMSRLVERMCNDGLVDKCAAESDRRGVVLHITDEGRKVEERARTAFDDRLASLFAGCPPEFAELCLRYSLLLTKRTDSCA